MKRYLRIEYKDFLGTILYKSVEDETYNGPCCFSSSLLKNPKTIETYFGNDEAPWEDMNWYEAKIQRAYLDLYSGKIHRAVICFRDVTNHYNFFLLNYNKNSQKYEIQTIKRKFNEFVFAEEEQVVLPPLGMQILSAVKDMTVPETRGISNNPCFESPIYYVDAKSIDETLRQILCIQIAEKFGNVIGEKVFDTHVKLVKFSYDINDLNDPYLIAVEFEYQSKKYKYNLYPQDGENEIDEINDILEGDTPSGILLPVVGLGNKLYKERYSEVLVDNKNKTNIEKIKSIILKEFKSNKVSVEEDDGDIRFTFKTHSDEDAVIIQDIVYVKPSRNFDDEVDEYVNFEIDDVAKGPAKLIETIKEYLRTKPKEYVEFAAKRDRFLSPEISFEEAKAIAETILDDETKLMPVDKSDSHHSKLLQVVKEKIEKIKTTDNKKISKVLESMKAIKDATSYEKHAEEFFDLESELSDVERLAIKDQIDEFETKFGSIDDYHPVIKSVRRVLIDKEVLEKLKEIDRDDISLKLLPAADELVDNLKKLPASELGKYLVSKGLNRPVKNDRSILKIRIKNTLKYRLGLVFGCELDADRSDNADSIYIFAITEHEAGSEAHLAELKPDKYEVNKFIVYPRDKRLVIPECSKQQYEIANCYDNRPSITFGCAGSGKTTVSIEQYVNIAWTKYFPKMPTDKELVYVTYHRGLADKARKDLAEFSLQGNCYRLDEYFAHVLGRTIDTSKAVSEEVFIKWYDQNFGEKQKNKFRNKDKISALQDKPDIARLIYTYYRGVFRGSRVLYDQNKPYVDRKDFLSERSGETYLSETEKDAIYELCIEFYKYVTKEKYVGDNELALEIINSKNFGLNKTECIIVDEVQDITEIDLIALIMSLNNASNRIYFYGDPHQSIHPNLFDSHTLNKVYSTLNKNDEVAVKPLDITYRTNKHLISYLQELSVKRDEWIGKTEGGISDMHKPKDMDESTSWAGYVNNPNLFKKILEADYPNCIIITPSAKVRDELIKRYPTLTTGRVITIYQAKGMEWDTVIMYNMFTDYEPYFIDMISGNGKAKRSTIHRMTFNKFYVGCTRSRKSFVIIEENDDLLNENNEIFQNLISSFAPITKAEQIDTYIREETTFEAWYQEALQNMENENEHVFNHALSHAQALAKTPEQIKLVTELLEGKPEVLHSMAFNNLDMKNYSVAYSIFVKLYRKTKDKTIEPYITFCRMMAGRSLKEEHIRIIIRNQQILNAYPDGYRKLYANQFFKGKLNKVISRLEESKKLKENREE